MSELRDTWSWSARLAQGRRNTRRHSPASITNLYQASVYHRRHGCHGKIPMDWIVQAPVVGACRRILDHETLHDGLQF
jgi:hypothetical protein